MNKKILEEVVGWYGTDAIISAYALLSVSLLSPQVIIYQALNCTGALGIVYISLRKKAYQPGVLNMIWSIIALTAIVRQLL
jgi:hypothetical protein